MARFIGNTGKKTSEYQAWQNMKLRCYWSGWRDYHRYGGRDITVCNRWKNSFDNFLADMGNKPSSRHQLDRIDNDGNYEPGNCQWVLPRENARNRSDTRLITYNGKTQCLWDWSRELNIHHATLTYRLNCGKSPEQAFKMRKYQRTTCYE